jgi:hypothetical protein
MRRDLTPTSRLDKHSVETGYRIYRIGRLDIHHRQQCSTTYRKHRRAFANFVKVSLPTNMHRGIVRARTHTHTWYKSLD